MWLPKSRAGTWACPYGKSDGNVMARPLGIDFSQERIESFCGKWRIIELSLFGSVLRDDFRPDSDIDVMVTFADGSHWTLFDLMDMQDELQSIFGRKVDLLTRKGVEQSRNYIRKREILSTAEVWYAA